MEFQFAHSESESNSVVDMIDIPSADKNDDTPRSLDSDDTIASTTRRVFKRYKLRNSTTGASTQVDMTPPNVLLKGAADMAAKYTQRGKVNEAMKELVRCLALTRIVYGDGHWRLGKCHSNLAQGYLQLRNLPEQSKQHAEIAKSIFISNIQKDLPKAEKDEITSTLALTYCILGKALTRQKLYDEAERALHKADKVCMETQQIAVLDPTSSFDLNIQVVQSLGALAICKKDYALAISCYEKALELTKMKCGEDGDELVGAYQELGRAEQLGSSSTRGPSSGVGSQDRAIENFLQAHSIASANHPGATLQTAQSAEVLARGYIAMETDDCERCAESYLKEALDTFQQILGGQHADTLRVQTELCKLFICTNRPDEATESLKNGLPNIRSLYGDLSEQVAETHKLLGSIKLSQGELVAAHKHFRKALDMLTAIFGSNHKKTKEIEKTVNLIAQSPQMRGAHGNRSNMDSRPHFSTVFGTNKPKSSAFITSNSAS